MQFIENEGIIRIFTGYESINSVLDKETESGSEVCSSDGSSMALPMKIYLFCGEIHG